MLSVAEGTSRRCVRTRTGPFTLEEAIEPAELSAESLCQQLRPALDAVPNLPRLALDAREVDAIVQGKRLPIADLQGDVNCISGQVALLDPEGTLIALAELDHDLRLGPASQGLDLAFVPFTPNLDARVAVSVLEIGRNGRNSHAYSGFFVDVALRAA